MVVVKMCIFSTAATTRSATALERAPREVGVGCLSSDFCGARWFRWLLRPPGPWRMIEPRGLSDAVVDHVVVTIGKTHVFSKSLEFHMVALGCCH